MGLASGARRAYLVIVLVTVVKYDPRYIRPFKGEKNKQSGIVIAGLIY